jgi:hypothetical protein
MPDTVKTQQNEPAANPASEGREPAGETAKPVPPKEIGGRDGPDPVRYGDWEKNGRCIDF